MRVHKKFSEILLRARAKQGLTQNQVAEAVSISLRWYQRLERGDKLPGTIVMLRLILLLHIDVEELRDVLDILPPPPR